MLKPQTLVCLNGIKSGNIDVHVETTTNTTCGNEQSTNQSQKISEDIAKTIGSLYML